MNRAAFYAELRKRNSGLFGTSLSQRQVDGIEGLLDAFAEVGDGKADTLGYGLGTVYHETGRRMVPVREGFAKSDAVARKAVQKLAARRGPNSNVAKYAQPQPPYGHVYYGRGHVQLTWIDNYRTSSKDASIDLVKHPDAMLDPKISARVLFRGLLDGRWNGRRKGLRYYLDRGDWIGARRTVNVQDRAAEIAEYGKDFLRAIEAAGGWKQDGFVRPDAEPPAQPRNVALDKPVSPPRGQKPGVRGGIAAALAAVIAAIVAFAKSKGWF